LAILAELGQASLESLALRLGTDAAEVRQFVEPHLMQLGLIDIASGGRRLTTSGRELANTLRQPEQSAAHEDQ
jgi:Holliday junction resolvasome RuvABC ATP-dependent DNA helicase subunit